MLVAIAPFFKPKFLIKAIDGFLSSYLLTFTIFKISSFTEDWNSRPIHFLQIE